MAADGISGGGNGGYRFDMPSMHGVDFSKEDLKISLPKKIHTIEELLQGGTKIDESDRTSSYLSFEINPDKVGVDQSIAGNSMDKLG